MSKITSIPDSILDKLTPYEMMKLQDVLDSREEVAYLNGREDGYEEGYNYGYDHGYDMGISEDSEGY